MKTCCPINVRRCPRNTCRARWRRTGCCSATPTTMRSKPWTCTWALLSPTSMRARHRVEVTDGSHFEYEKLLLATGSRPRPLPVLGAELAGVHYLRTVADVDRLRAEMKTGGRAVIIGGGYIGLEVASTCREAGLDVTVVEAADRVMSRVISPVLSRFYEAEHARHGVQVLLRRPAGGAGVRRSSGCGQSPGQRGAAGGRARIARGLRAGGHRRGVQ